MLYRLRSVAQALQAVVSHKMQQKCHRNLAYRKEAFVVMAVIFSDDA
jgi:hypothetical protein